MPPKKKVATTTTTKKNHRGRKLPPLTGQLAVINGHSQPTANSTPAITPMPTPAMSAPAQMTHASVPPTTNSSQVNSVTQATESSQVTNSTTNLSQDSGLYEQSLITETPYSQMSAAEKKLSAVWTDADDAIMVHKLIDEKSAHPSVLNGFKGTSWAQVVKALEELEDTTGSKRKDVP
ncbi:hypothetical protein MJO28_003080 [Puccinia striiformis f. sp. tritici]|uniref:Uncharacterized protein n=1 Tax=Puccinia striiformis f. sp. tritici TaxID=168172 RepID=A0ACC0ESI0_9BASI|nr:hypothetical protein Pst134EA_005004 [Puccinia striiformis f. sp. tritici]KAH9471096.1 hypothetical protein Pst134EA_005004 [Puccinia striiformis f. sp. tritici]KAI7959289.1 hypothetical protein MJO28_003080 [Puccinia striiformis f. sp. tritici]KAI7965053.1 hypothetical protein MJO29_003151 [Puccinia striiformis f. sp. tritici]